MSPAMNSTYVDPAFCTYANCSVQDYGQLEYIPSLPGNALYLSIFCLALVAQTILGICYRTWGFLAGMIGGTALEIVGYTARVQLHYNVFSRTFFIIYLVGVTIGPAFFSAAIYLCLARIIAIYGVTLSCLTPRTITVVFICCDFISLALQAAGGAIASLFDTETLGQTGVNIMIAGLASQVASTAAFCVLCLQLMRNVYTRPREVNPNSKLLRESLAFHFFLISIGVATVAILIRCSFRVAELSRGFRSELANDQVSFMILDGAMMSITVLVLTAGHPGPILGVTWKDGGFSFRGNSRVTQLDFIPHSLTNGEVKEKRKQGRVSESPAQDNA